LFRALGVFEDRECPEGGESHHPGSVGEESSEQGGCLSTSKAGRSQNRCVAIHLVLLGVSSELEESRDCLDSESALDRSQGSVEVATRTVLLQDDAHFVPEASRRRDRSRRRGGRRKLDQEEGEERGLNQRESLHEFLRTRNCTR